MHSGQKNGAPSYSTPTQSSVVGGGNSKLASKIADLNLTPSLRNSTAYNPSPANVNPLPARLNFDPVQGTTPPTSSDTSPSSTATSDAAKKSSTINRGRPRTSANVRGAFARPSDSSCSTTTGQLSETSSSSVVASGDNLDNATGDFVEEPSEDATNGVDAVPVSDAMSEPAAAPPAAVGVDKVDSRGEPANKDGQQLPTRRVLKLPTS